MGGAGLLARVADWDSYWVVLGLLAVDMRETATSLTANLLDAVRTHGFVPNGLRTYYLHRSQPPHLLTVCVEWEQLCPCPLQSCRHSVGPESQGSSLPRHAATRCIVSTLRAPRP